MAVDVKTSPKFETGEPKLLFNSAFTETLTVSTLFLYDVTPDGKRFLLIAPVGYAAAPITVVLNWQQK